ncbi:TonB-dependent receptor [Sphingomonas sp. OK281]|uniref:TonB-dependent receptor n=1 Tax=Sphingomonas sp. OK281 TaxID=1881067 RepID=UPI0020C90266|nr:TonB-dependent receptor [Sphingomonas sp. OK281]
MRVSAARSIASVAVLATMLVIADAAVAQTAPAISPEPTADTPIEGEIIVTAQRREERSRDVPISITSISEAQLATANINQLSDVARVTPALRFDSSGSFSQPTIRGVGTAVTTSGGGPNVGIYVDGFYVANPEATAFDLTKTRSIQVLKGPQGTLFGRNTTGGAILVTTAEPSTKPAAEFKATYGRFNAQTYQGYATVGLSDRIAVDVEGLLRKGDGYFRNIANDDDKVGKYENWSVRTGIKVDVTDGISVLLRYTHSKTDDPTLLLTNAYVDPNGGSGFYSRVPTAAYGTNDSTGRALVYAFAPPSTYTTRPGDVINVPSTPTRFTNKTDAFQGTIKADLGFADLTSYTQVRKDDAVNLQDLDATAIPLFNINLGIGNRTFTQEFLFTSKPGGALQWTAGLYYFRNRDTYFVNAAFGPPPYMPFGGSSTTTKSYAAFVDATYELSPRLFLTAGVRYGHDVVGDAYFLIPVTQVRFDVPDYKTNRVTPRAVLRYKPSDVSSVYASFSRGYKAGILNVGGASAVPIKPEGIDAFEVGYKYDDRRLSFDIAAYYYFYKNLQVSSFQSGLALITNAASSRIGGIESSARYKLTSAFDLTIGGAYTHARYRNFTQAPFYSYCDPTGAVPSLVCGAIGAGSITQTTNDSSGYQMQRAPDFTGNVGATYHTALVGGKFSLSGNLYYTSSFYFDASKQYKQKGYEVAALRVQWVDPSDRFTLAVFGDNLTDKRYRNQVLFNTLGIGAVWNSPRTWGVSLGAKF